MIRGACHRSATRHTSSKRQRNDTYHWCSRGSPTISTQMSIVLFRGRFAEEWILYSRRNLHHQRYIIHYYITCHCVMRRLTLFMAADSYPSYMSLQNATKPSSLDPRSGSTNFASARIPFVALADMLAATSLHGVSACRIACVKGERAWMRVHQE